MNNLGYSDIDYAKFRKTAWLSLIGFSIMYALLYNGRMNLSLAQANMMDQLGWSSAEIGLVSSVLFWTYGIGHLFNGRLGEILGIKRFIMAGVLLSVLANVLLSFSSSIILIAILWGLNGYFQSMVWSPGMGLLSSWWPRSQRGFATGLATGASGLSQVVAWLCIGASFTLFPSLGWRAAFNIPMSITLIGGIVFWVMSKQSPKDVGLQDYIEQDVETKATEDSIASSEKSKSLLYAYKMLFTNWRFILMCFVIASSSICRYGLLTLVPRYYKEVMDMNIVSGIFKSVVLPLGMAAGSFFTPWLSDKIAKVTHGSRMPAVVGCSLLASITVFLFASTTSEIFGAVLLFLAGYFVYSINGVIWAYSTDIGTRAFASTAAGVLDWAAYMGAAVQAIVFGLLLGDADNWNLVFISISGFAILILVLSLIVGIKPKTARN